MNSSTPSCASCGINAQNLKFCAKCHSEHYCSRDCQKAHWKTHKKVCAAEAGANTARAYNDTSNTKSKFESSSSSSGTAPHVANLETPIEKPFHRLDDGTWLHGRSESDTFKLLIDAYRLRMSDDYTFSGYADDGSVMDGVSSDSSVAFRRFLKKITKQKPNLLPQEWWTEEKAKECVERGLEVGVWESLRAAPEKGDFVEYYENPTMPMQLRMFAELVYGKGLGGQDGSMMRKMMMEQESGGGGGGGITSMFSLS